MPYSILLVDDEKLISDIIKSRIESDEINLYQAYNGMEAIEIVRKNKIDLIVQDINMPGINGIDVIRILKSDEKFKKIKIIVLTSLDDKETMDTVKSLGIDAFFNKPFRTSQLLEKINELIV